MALTSAHNELAHSTVHMAQSNRDDMKGVHLFCLCFCLLEHCLNGSFKQSIRHALIHQAVQ